VQSEVDQQVAAHKVCLEIRLYCVRLAQDVL
jgi:hypothetical protein